MIKMKPKILFVLVALSEFMMQLEIPSFVVVHSQSIGQTSHLNGAKKLHPKAHKEEKKGETLFLECKQKGSTMECKPTKKQASKKVAEKHRRTRKKPVNHRHDNKPRLKEKHNEKVVNLEAKLLQNDRKIAKRLHNAIHEAHEHVPSFNQMLQLVNEIIDEEYQKHSKLIVRKEIHETELEKRRKERRNRRKRQKLSNQKSQEKNEKKMTNKKSQNSKAERVNQAKPSARVTSDKAHASLTKKQPLETMKNQLLKKKKMVHQKKFENVEPSPSKADVQKVKESIRKLMEKNNDTKSTQTGDQPASNNVDLNYILNRLASKRKEFLDKVMCSTSKKNERTFEQIVDVPWIGFPSENTFMQGQTVFRKVNNKKPQTMNVNMKTPFLKSIPQKMNNLLEDEDSAEGSGEYDDDDVDSSADGSDYKQQKRLHLKNILLSGKSRLLSMPSIMYSTPALALQNTEKLMTGDKIPVNNKKLASSFLPNFLIASNIESSGTTIPSSISFFPTPAYNFATDNQVGHMTINADPNEFVGFSTSDEIYPDHDGKEKPKENLDAPLTKPSSSSQIILGSIASGLNSMQGVLEFDHVLSSVSATVGFSASYGNHGNIPIMDQILAETFDRGMNAHASLSRIGGESNLIMPSSSKDMIYSNMIQATVYVSNNNHSQSIIGKNFLVRLKMLRIFNESLLYRRNEEYKKLKKKLEESIKVLYKDDDTFHSSKLVAFSRIPTDNTTLVDIEIYFKMRSHDHLTRLDDTLKNMHTLADEKFEEKIIETSLLNDRITDIRWCVPPCYNPYHCFPLCDDTCCSIPPNAFDTSQGSHNNRATTQQVQNNPAPYIVYNYIVTTPEELTKHARDVFGSKPYEINAFTSQVDPETGNILCGPYCSPYYCLPSCLRKCCFRK